MQFKQGASVYSSDDREVGHIDRVVMDPRTKEVTNLIIRQGFIFTEDKVLPISVVATTSEDRVTLRADADSLDNLQTFEETYYIPEYGQTETDYPAGYARPLYAYPPVGGMMGYPALYHPVGATSPEIEQIERNIPEDTIALKEGARVITTDEQHVGNIERVFMSSDSDQVTHFLISQGLLFKEHKLVPIDWVSTITEDEVDLAVRSDLLNSLPPYKE